MNRYIVADLAEADQEKMMKKVRETFNKSWEFDIVRFWFEKFPEGATNIGGANGNTDTSSASYTLNMIEDQNSILGTDQLFENWYAVAKYMKQNTEKVQWKQAAYHFGDQEWMRDEFGIDDVEEVFENKDEIEILKMLIDGDQLDPLFLFRQNASPVAKWLSKCRSF